MEKSKTKTESRLRIIEDYYTIIIQIEEIVVEKAYFVCKNDNLLPRTTISNFFSILKKSKTFVFLSKSQKHIYQQRKLKRDHAYMEREIKDSKKLIIKKHIFL